MTSNPMTSNPMTASISTRLEVFAASERHMQQRDLLISERIGCDPAYWQAKREEGEAGLLFWEMMEQKAMMTPPRLRPSQITAQRQQTFAPGEYLRRSERRSDPAASRWDWLGWAVILFAGTVIFGERIPGVHDFLVSLFR